MIRLNLIDYVVLRLIIFSVFADYCYWLEMITRKKENWQVSKCWYEKWRK